jgi:hypothetical protein
MPVIFITMMLSQAAFAGLGSKIDTLSKDRQILSAKKLNVVSHNQYTVHTMKSGSSTINYYADSNDMVFAVTWRGLAHPDLSVILDSNFGLYQSAVSAMKAQKTHSGFRGQRHFRVASNTLVVQKAGHMRDWRGIAYDSSLIPSGVSLNELK